MHSQRSDERVVVHKGESLEDLVGLMRGSLSPQRRPSSVAPVSDHQLSALDDVPVPSSFWEEFLIYWLFVLIGVGYLFPFSALTQPVDYWKKLFPDRSLDFDVTATFMYTNLVMLFVLVFASGKSTINFTRRMVGGFLGQFLVLVVVPSSYFLHLHETSNYLLIMGGTAFVAVATAFLDSSVIALAMQYPFSAQQALQVGVGLSTLIGSVYRDITKAAMPRSEVILSSLIYFYTGAVTVLLCLLGYIWLTVLPISKQIQIRRQISLENQLTAQLLEDGEGESEGDGGAKGKEDVSVLSVLTKVGDLHMVIALVFTASLSVWPSLIADLPAFQFESLNDSQWWPLLLLTLFSVMDVVGRSLLFCRFGLTRVTIWVPCLARTLLVPLLVMVKTGGFPLLAPRSDLFVILVVTVMGFTNGHTGSLAIIFVKEAVDQRESNRAGAMSSFFLNFGLVLGASVGLLLKSFVIG